VVNLRELQELIALVKDKHLPPVATTCMHFSKAFTALLAREEGKAVGRQVLPPPAPSTLECDARQFRRARFFETSVKFWMNLRSQYNSGPAR